MGQIKRERGRLQYLSKVFKYPLISGTGKAADFMFGLYIPRVHANKTPLKILQKRERGRIQGLPKVLKYPLLAQEHVKLRSSNFARTFIYDRLQQKPINNFRKSSRGMVGDGV